jgi:hypothetical protein
LSSRYFFGTVTCWVNQCFKKMAAPEIKLPFGVDATNRLVHVSDVVSGKACGCICPSCRSPLIAAKGSIKQHHFKHADGTGCATGLESAIHRAAKQLIREKMQITLPPRALIMRVADGRGRRHNATQPLVRPNTVMSFDTVEEEVELFGMKADILAAKGNRQLIIEICYRHKVDDEKRAKIKNANISAIEIDLSNLWPDDVSNWRAFWREINQPDRGRWLHNAKDGAAYEALEVRLPSLMEAYEREFHIEMNARKAMRRKL